MEREEFYVAIRRFLSDETGAEHEALTVLARLRDDDDLYELGLVDSLTVIRMVILVEELTGREIDLADHEFETFYTLRGLYTVATAP